jgi:hypothetical protein
MQDKPIPFDAGRAWSDAMALLKGQLEILLTITGFFIMLPALLLNALRPFVPSGKSETWMAEVAAWTEANFVWIALVAVLAALGRLAMLILLLGPDRPTVGEALAAGAKLLAMFVIMDVLIGLMLLGGSLFFIVPAIYIFGRTFLAEAGFVARRVHNPVAGLTAGFEASRGNGWRIVLMAAIIYVAGVILTAAIGSIVGVIGALAGGTGLDRFLTAFVDAICGAGVSLVLVLVSVAAWRQLGQQGNLRGGVAR